MFIKISLFDFVHSQTFFVGKEILWSFRTFPSHDKPDFHTDIRGNDKKGNHFFALKNMYFKFSSAQAAENIKADWRLFLKESVLLVI